VYVLDYMFMLLFSFFLILMFLHVGDTSQPDLWLLFWHALHFSTEQAVFALQQ